MEDNIKLLSDGLLGSLIKNDNTIVSVTHFNNVLCNIYNSRHPKNKIHVALLSSAKNGDIYDKLIAEYKELLEKKINKKVIIELLPANMPFTVDCMKIIALGGKYGSN